MQLGTFVCKYLIPCTEVTIVRIAKDGTVQTIYQGVSDVIENNTELFNRYTIGYMSAKGDKVLIYVRE